MAKIPISLLHRHLDPAKHKRVAIITQTLRPETVYEEGQEETRYSLRGREELLKGQLLKLGIKHIAYSVSELETRIEEVAKKGSFDLCIVTGEEFYQLIRTAAKLRKARYKGPIFIEVTEEEARKESSRKAAQAYAKQYESEDLLRRLVYLTKAYPSDAPREIEFDIAAQAPEVDVARASRQKPPRAAELESQSVDLEEPPKRFNCRVTRVIRDTKAARALKARYSFCCQVCGFQIQVAADAYLSEVHHVRPLGGDHKGWDTASNMLVLCPNHHAIFDVGACRFVDAGHVMIGEALITLTTKHTLSEDVVAYHNSRFANKVFTAGHKNSSQNAEKSPATGAGLVT